MMAKMVRIVWFVMFVQKVEMLQHARFIEKRPLEDGKMRKSSLF
jgi:hypothetical protein